VLVEVIAISLPRGVPVRPRWWTWRWNTARSYRRRMEDVVERE
jgi:hypothetical protein